MRVRVRERARARACVCVCVCVCVFFYLYIYKSNFINNILIKTIKNDTFKQFVQTTAPVHAFFGNGNTINSQPSSERF